MSIANEITNYANGLGDAYGAVNDMGGIIPQDKNMNNLDTAIRTIPQSTGPTYTAGTGIDITNDVISIDHTVVAELTDLPGVFTGATSLAAGTSGLVPAPQIGEEGYLLCGNGTWVPVTLPTYVAGTGIDITNDVISFDDSVLTHGALEFQTGQGTYTFTENSSNQTTTIVIPEYSDFTGATSSVAGSNGLVPAPSAGDDTKFLAGDGTWKTAGGGGNVVSKVVYGDIGYSGTGITLYSDSALTQAITYQEWQAAVEDPNVYLQLFNVDGDYLNPMVVGANAIAIFIDYAGGVTIEVRPDESANETFELIYSSLQRQLIAGSNIQIALDGKTISATDTTYSDFTGATASVAGAHGLVPAPAAGDEGKALHGDGTWKDTTAKLVEMSYGEANAWAKFIAAYNAGSIVYCRASSNANPGTGSQTRKAFMAYVNNATNPTNVEFQYVRSQSSKTDSQQTDQVFVYTLTNASGGTWSVASRNMGPKINVSGPITKTFTSGANATITIGADAMTGATASTAGAAGIVPAPAAGDNTKFLKGDGSWADVPEAPLTVYMVKTADSTHDYTATFYEEVGHTNTINYSDLNYEVVRGRSVIVVDGGNNKGAPLTAAAGSPKGQGDMSMIIGDQLYKFSYKTSTVANLDVDTISDSSNTPVITMTDTDPGEGGSLAANNFIFVYDSGA